LSDSFFNKEIFMKKYGINILGVMVFLATSLCVGPVVAGPKVQKYSPCEKFYNSMVRRVTKIGATHYAVATTGGRGLNASGTGCGFDNGFDTKSAMQRSALQQCNIAKKRGGYPGKCKIIESK
jgi:hypothetical protein